MLKCKHVPIIMCLSRNHNGLVIWWEFYCLTFSSCVLFCIMHILYAIRVIYCNNSQVGTIVLHVGSTGAPEGDAHPC